MNNLSCLLLLASSWFSAACSPQPQQAGDHPASPVRPLASLGGSLPVAEATLALDHDTLRVPGGVVAVRARLAADFERLPVDPQPLLEHPDEALAALSTWDRGRVRRKGNHLLLRPVTGPLVSFRNVPDRQPPDAVSDGGAYHYQGWWSGTGYWLVAYDGLPHFYTLLDQRTGRRLRLASPDVSFSPDGQLFLLLNARYVNGQAPPYGLALYRLSPTGPLAKRLWLRELPEWGTLGGVRWAGPRTILLKRSPIPERAGEAPAVSYVELQLPTPR